MTTSEQRIQTLLRKAPVRSQDLVAAGLSRSEISRRVAAGKLLRISRGIYAAPGYEQGEHGSMAAVATRAPSVVFCLLTALRFHELTTQSPFELWIAIGNKDHPPRMNYPPLRVVRFSEEALVAGVEKHIVSGTAIRVTSIAKTIADCFKFRGKVGLDVALEALREAKQSRRVTSNDLWRYAKINRVANVMRPYLEAIS